MSKALISAAFALMVLPTCKTPNSSQQSESGVKGGGVFESWGNCEEFAVMTPPTKISRSMNFLINQGIDARGNQGTKTLDATDRDSGRIYFSAEILSGGTSMINYETKDGMRLSGYRTDLDVRAVCDESACPRGAISKVSLFYSDDGHELHIATGMGGTLSPFYKACSFNTASIFEHFPPPMNEGPGLGLPGGQTTGSCHENCSSGELNCRNNVASLEACKALRFKMAVRCPTTRKWVEGGSCAAGKETELMPTP